MNPARNSFTAGRRALLLALSGVLLVTFGWMLAGDTGEAMAAPQPAASSAPTANPQPASQGQAAKVEGKVITLSEVEVSAAEHLEQLEMQRLQMEHRLSQERQQILLNTLEEMVEERLLTLEAEAQGVTREELLSQHVQVQPVTDEDIGEFYQELIRQRPQGVPPQERIADQIRSHLQEARQTEARDAYFGELREKYAVELYLQEPRAEIAADGFPSKGPADAPVTIVEFSDFQCSFCARVVPTLNRVLESYGDQVRLVYRHFPLHIHPNAQKAAEASLCAQDQGKFWEMHDLMFENQQSLSMPELKEKARRLGLDGGQFDQCLDSDRHAEAVKRDFREGSVVGVSGTPAMFINGRFVSGAVPYEQLAQIIDEELQRANGASRR